MKKAISIILTVIGSLIIIFAAFLMVSGTIALKNNKPVYVFGYAFATVPTDSMVGTNSNSLDINDIVIIKKTTIDDINIGDVIVYQGKTSNGVSILIIHRVYDEVAEGYITKGDNNATTDQNPENSVVQDYITANNLEAKYVAKITFLKPLSSLMQSSRSYIFLALTVVILILLVSEVLNIVKTYNKEKSDELALEHEKQLAEIEKQKAELYEQIKKEEENKIK